MSAIPKAPSVPGCNTKDNKLMLKDLICISIGIVVVVLWAILTAGGITIFSLLL
ncbi:MAG: hypothetical protein K0R80_1599 [Clostridia bacterium]|jgi:hypothetical protein|nr:hypothetical protein [Clostridia bacterium]